ncbi:MAG: type II toxin-antitoxin system HicA family toxin [Methanosarcinales archaeon]|nr:type II toxin-antitoxin system HicA family toxin [Methanosarcinales archaeon]MCD4808677.1 type II toxin-antitoxin system HicA family toxin [Methanosarcinales archaeon]
MKRRKLLRHLEKHGCKFLREGGNHTVFYNPLNMKTSTVPRHTEIMDALAKKICKDLEVPQP